MTALRQHPARPRPLRQRGLSIVELMVGVTIGLFILAGTTMMLTTQLGDNRRLLLEAQMQQDMRAAADMIARDIRRAGYWAQAYRQVWPDDPDAPPMANPYRVMTPAAAANGSTSVVYDRSTDEERGNMIGTDDNAVDGVAGVAGGTREQVGFQLNELRQTIDYLVGNGWQALTDPAVMRVTQFSLIITARDLPCVGACPIGPGGCPLRQSARDVTVTIIAQAVHDPAVQRSLQDNIRLRNDVLREEVC